MAAGTTRSATRDPELSSRDPELSSPSAHPPLPGGAQAVRGEVDDEFPTTGRSLEQSRLLKKQRPSLRIRDVQDKGGVTPNLRLNLGPLTPEHHGNRPILRYQKTRPDNKKDNRVESAAPTFDRRQSSRALLGSIASAFLAAADFPNDLYSIRPHRLPASERYRVGTPSHSRRRVVLATRCCRNDVRASSPSRLLLRIDNSDRRPSVAALP